MIGQTVPPLPEGVDVNELRRYVERELGRMQKEIYLLRQFIEPMVVLTENTPNRVFDSIT